MSSGGGRGYGRDTDASIEQCAARGELLASLLRERVLPLKHVGDVRGMGLFWGIELVADKDAKTPFQYKDNVNGKLADAILARGVAVYHGAGCVSPHRPTARADTRRTAGRATTS